jgi:hypothetical protein
MDDENLIRADYYREINKLRDYAASMGLVNIEQLPEKHQLHLLTLKELIGVHQRIVEIVKKREEEKIWEFCKKLYWKEIFRVLIEIILSLKGPELASIY